MPYVRKSKKSSRKPAKKSTRKSIKRYRKSPIPRLIFDGTLSPKMMAKMVYSDTYTMSDFYVSGGAYQYGWVENRANGLYDPHYTATLNTGEIRNGQPRYYDQIATFYNNLRVMGAKLKVTFINTSASADQQLLAFAYFTNPGASDSPPTASDFVSEHPFLATNKRGTAIVGSSDGGNNVKTLTSTWSSSGLNAMDKIQNQADWGEDPEPVALFKWGVCQANSNGVDPDWQCSIQLVIEYDVLLTQPKYASTS